MNWGLNTVGGYNSASSYARGRATAATGNSDFFAVLSSAKAASTSSVDEYTDYLKSKYGNVTIQSVGKDQKSLDAMGKSMGGNDVVIAPNILAEMATDPEKAAYYEQKIDYFFDSVVPRESASFAAKGLVFEPCGVVVHEDGTVTYISGCSDSPERVAEVNAINKAKEEKEAAQRKEILERSMEAAEERRREALSVSISRNTVTIQNQN